VGMALRLETEFGTALDVEWAVEDGRSVILQARPITTTRAGPTGGPIDEGREEGFDGRHEKGRDTGRGDAFDDGFDVCGGPQRRYTTAGIAEMLPGYCRPGCGTSTPGSSMRRCARFSGIWAPRPETSEASMRSSPGSGVGPPSTST